MSGAVADPITRFEVLIRDQDDKFYNFTDQCNTNSKIIYYGYNMKVLSEISYSLAKGAEIVATSRATN